MCQWQRRQLKVRYVRISLVRAFLEGLLGSPAPMSLVARTLNSYSTQGLKSTTVAASCFPPSSSGTERHQRRNLSSVAPEEFAKLEMCYLLRFHVSELFWKGDADRQKREKNPTHQWWQPATPERKAFWPGWCSSGLGCGCPVQLPTTERRWSRSSRSPGSPRGGPGDLEG